MRTILLPLLALLLIGCPDKDGDEDLGPVEYHVSLAEPADGDEGPLADGESIEIASISESREALLVILEGVPAPAVDEPLAYGLVRSVEAELYLDRDADEGPEQWISIAEVQDDDGNVLWTNRVNTLFQLLEYLSLILEQQSALNFGVTQVFSYVFMQYPSLLEFGVRVPLGIEGGTQYVLKVPKEDGAYYEAFRANISDLVAGAVPPSVTGEVTTIVENGDPADTIDIVILADGYTADQREDFDLDSRAVADRLARTEPFKTKMDSINVHAVWTPSAEYGAGYDCTNFVNTDCERLRDTVFGNVFVLTALADRLEISLEGASDRVAMPLEVGKLFDVASLAKFDEILLVSNTRRRSGFAGLYVSIVTAYDQRREWPDVAVHELGHSFGVLGDEYSVTGDPCLANQPRIPLPANISDTASRDELKWAHLVEEDTPLPTTLADLADVGAYAGAYNCAELFRPANNCKMNNSDSTFCGVCSEQLVTRMFSSLDPLVHNSTATASREGDEFVFRVTPRDETIGVQWLIGDDEVGMGSELRLKPLAVPTTWSELTVRAFDASGFVVGERPQTAQSLNLWVRR